MKGVGWDRGCAVRRGRGRLLRRCLCLFGGNFFPCCFASRVLQVVGTRLGF
jgi:hypothetical protein